MNQYVRGCVALLLITFSCLVFSRDLDQDEALRLREKGVILPLEQLLQKAFEYHPKAKLLEGMSPGNQDKTKAAPVTVIIGMDMAFYEQLPKLFPHADARSWFVGNDPLIEATAFRNSTLQGGYLIMAARSLGLDCGPMSGYDQPGLDAEFFAGTQVKSNFLVNIGYGDPNKNLFGRLPRFAFDEVAQIL